MKYPIILFTLFFASSIPLMGQYQFEPIHEIQHTPIKDQCNTGTCWSFSTISFLESEAARMTQQDVNLSEMYIVRNIYMDKGMNYMLRQGKAQFSEGGLAHDVINTLDKHGVVPQGKTSIKDPAYHDHNELVSILTGMLKQLIKDKTIGKNWKRAYNAVLDIFFGFIPEKFSIDNKEYNPMTYAESLGLDADNYINLTSFTHHPYHDEFILEIPDNYSNGSYWNLPMSDLEKSVDSALEKGYTVAWDGDVSENFFRQSKGLAVNPEKGADGFSGPVKEIEYDVKKRQELFENYSTTDDHLMHIVGLFKDQKGNQYYKIKNSWGEEGPYKGYLYMSKSYFQFKTVSVTLHKDAIPKGVIK